MYENVRFVISPIAYDLGCHSLFDQSTCVTLQLAMLAGFTIWNHPSREVRNIQMFQLCPQEPSPTLSSHGRLQLDNICTKWTHNSKLVEKAAQRFLKTSFWYCHYKKTVAVKSSRPYMEKGCNIVFIWIAVPILWTRLQTVVNLVIRTWWVCHKHNFGTD